MYDKPRKCNQLHVSLQVEALAITRNSHTTDFKSSTMRHKFTTNSLSSRSAMTSSPRFPRTLILILEAIGPEEATSVVRSLDLASRLSQRVVFPVHLGRDEAVFECLHIL